MSGDEVVVLVASLAAGPVAWAKWVHRLLAVRPFGTRRPSLVPSMAALAFCAVVLALVLKTLAAPDVRDDPLYLVLYFALGLAWMRAGEWLFAHAGVSVRDDVVERRNMAAVPATAGAPLGVTCCFAGGNIGAGPGWWVVVFSGLLATSALALVWLVVGAAARLADLVTIDRDVAAGTRVGGLLAASGLILGRAVAGDWHSVAATVADFVQTGGGVVPLAIGALVLDRVFQPTAVHPRPSVAIGGIVPALAYLAAAIAYVVFLGRPS